MKKIRKILLTVLSVFTLASLSLGVASCELIQPNPPITDNSSSQTTDNEFRQVYAMYVTYAEAQGETPLSYEAWLMSIRGEKGDKGENGVGIEKVEFDKDGNLVITFTDGTTQTVEMPKQETHVHTFGEWTALTEDAGCDNKLFFRACSECKSIEWEQRVNSGHDWKAEYSYDDSYHWIACNNCDKVKDKVEHTFDNSGKCTVCKQINDTLGVNYQVSEDGTYAEVVSYTGTAIDVVVADTYKDLPVTNISERAFENTKISSITIPDGVTSIGAYAFSYCSSLTSVTIPNSVTSIGREAFWSCSSLTGVYITDIVAWCNISFKDILSNPFYYNGAQLYLNNKLVAELVIPDSVTEIKSYAFSGCSSLTSVTIGNSVTSIGEHVFSGCGSLASVTIPNSVISIENFSFGDCNSLTSVYYKGTESDWNKISIGNGNSNLTNATRYYFDETSSSD